MSSFVDRTLLCEATRRRGTSLSSDDGGASGARKLEPLITDSITLIATTRFSATGTARRITLDAALVARHSRPYRSRDRPYTWLARDLRTAGRPDKARAVLAQFAQNQRHGVLRGGSRKSMKRSPKSRSLRSTYNDAIVEFRRADLAADGKPANDNPVRVHFNLGRAFDLANQPDSAIAELEAYTTVRSMVASTTTIRACGTHKRLGELYDAKGDREKAISHTVRSFVRALEERTTPNCSLRSRTRNAG
jgi:hypothetical protein